MTSGFLVLHLEAVLLLSPTLLSLLGEETVWMLQLRGVVGTCPPSSLPFKSFCSTTVYKPPAGWNTQIIAKSSYFSGKTFESDLVKQGRRVHQKPPLPRILRCLLPTREPMLKCLWFCRTKELTYLKIFYNKKVLLTFQRRMRSIIPAAVSSLF